MAFHGVPHDDELVVVLLKGDEEVAHAAVSLRKAIKEG